MFIKKTKPLKILFNDPEMFYDMYFRWCKNVAYTKFTHKVLKPEKYAGRRVNPDYVGNEKLKELVLSGKPFAVGRPGATEIGLIFQSETIKRGFKPQEADENYKMLFVNSGVFPRTADFIHKYVPCAIEALSQCDVLNVSYCVMEDYFYKKYMKQDTYLTYIRALDYWRFKEPWTKALKGKKVLVISPFADTISKQYKKRELLYKDTEILPEFTLYTVRAVQTGGMEKDDRFKDWFEALDYMYNESMKYDFDIAILSCGAYSLPLATKFKAAGKGAIHMGGVCQMLFGIKGRRYEDEPGAGDFFNENWVYPSADETPKSASSVENYAYWRREDKS